MQEEGAQLQLGFRVDDFLSNSYWIFAPFERLCFAHNSRMFDAVRDVPPFE
jgi:hypothetical protein